MTNIEYFDQAVQTIERFRKEEVTIWGSKVHCMTTEEIENNIHVDIMNVLETLKYNLSPLTEEMLDDLVDSGDAVGVYSNNTYNYSGNVSNDIAYHVYKYNDTYQVLVFVHLFGDARTNFTEGFVCQYEDSDDFIFALSDCSRYITVDGYDCCVSVLSDEVECTNIENFRDTFYCCPYDLESLKEMVQEHKEEIQCKSSN